MHRGHGRGHRRAPRGCRRRTALGRGAGRSTDRVHRGLSHTAHAPAPAAHRAVGAGGGDHAGVPRAHPPAVGSRRAPGPARPGLPLAARPARPRHAQPSRPAGAPRGQPRAGLARRCPVDLDGDRSLVADLGVLVTRRARSGVPRRARGAAGSRRTTRAAVRTLAAGRARSDPGRGAARGVRRVHARSRGGHEPGAHVPVATARRQPLAVQRRAPEPGPRRATIRRRRRAAVTPAAPARTSFGYFGFSKQLDTSLRGRPDDTLVMRVRASSPDFWRGQTFDTWNGRIWTVSDDRPNRIHGGQPIGIPRVPADGPVGSALDVDELVQTYYLEKPGPNAIFAASADRRRSTSPTGRSSRTRTAPCAPVSGSIPARSTRS